ncbi:MAG: excinuclease subunit [Novosphingobium sp.]|nr:excinuclease subunit [Novosphingobium sp.]
MQYGGWTYIMTNRAHGVLYVGVTSGIDRRMWGNRNGLGSKFCKKYGLDRLVLVEEHATIEEAIAREKTLKRWLRKWKIELIEAFNPDWDDLGVRFF